MQPRDLEQQEAIAGLVREPELDLTVGQSFASKEQPHMPLLCSSDTATHGSTALPRNRLARSVSSVATTAYAKSRGSPSSSACSCS